MKRFSGIGEVGFLFFRTGWLALLLGASLAGAQGEKPGPTKVTVDSAAALRKAVEAAIPGTRIEIRPGTYPGGHHFSGLKGTREAPIVIAGADPKDPPVFDAKSGGTQAFQFSACSHILLEHVKATGFSGNGINIDDGTENHGSVGMELSHVTIENTGPIGNHDALKLSGLYEFAVRDCTFAGWGGSAIDMVGCHEGVIERCLLRGREGYSQDSGIQTKGGTANVTVLRCRFLHAGQRAMNLGGSTDLPFFRPIDATWEARDIEVAGCWFVGSMAPVAFVGADRGHVHHNTFYLPERWVMRILQENTHERFVRCSQGRFENNLVVFDSQVVAFCNVGPATQSKTFLFKGNAWYCTDDPQREPKDLPSEDKGGHIRIDPGVELNEAGDLVRKKPVDPMLNDVGAEAWKPSDGKAGVEPTAKSVATGYARLELMTSQPVVVNPALFALCRSADSQEVAAQAEASGPHANTAIRVYMNALASSAFGKRGGSSYPVGAVVVKEKEYLGGSGGRERGLARPGAKGVGGMIKRQKGYDPENGDWEYFYFEEISRIESGKITSCRECHAKAASTDYVFGEWKGGHPGWLHQPIPD